MDPLSEKQNESFNINDKKWQILMEINGINNSWDGIGIILLHLCGNGKQFNNPDPRLFPLLKYFLERYSDYYEAGVQYLTDQLIEYTKNYPEYLKYVCKYINEHKMENQFTNQQTKAIYLNVIKD